MRIITIIILFLLIALPVYAEDNYGYTVFKTLTSWIVNLSKVLGLVVLLSGFWQFTENPKWAILIKHFLLAIGLFSIGYVIEMILQIQAIKP